MTLSTIYQVRRGDIGAGVNAQLTPNAGIWAEAGYQKGNKMESPVTGTVGLPHKLLTVARNTRPGERSARILACTEICVIA
ncbi:autotransporter outer membrane beta-barrel domain-containing protein [Escherichia coli]